MKAVFETERAKNGRTITKVKLKTSAQTMTLIPKSYRHAKEMVRAMMDAGCVDYVENI
jgi:hypothetical protein